MTMSLTRYYDNTNKRKNSQVLAYLDTDKRTTRQTLDLMVRIHLRVGLLARIQGNAHERLDFLGSSSGLSRVDDLGSRTALEDRTVTFRRGQCLEWKTNIIN